MHTIDATNKTPGRLATEVVRLLMGKYRTDYQPQIDNEEAVTVTNVEYMKLTKSRLAKKMYYRFSGYPGGLKKTLAKHMKKSDILWQAVHRMLPNNKLRAKRMKRLIIS